MAIGNLDEHPGFFDRSGPFDVKDVAKKVGAQIINGGHADLSIVDVLPLDKAGPGHMTFLDNPKYLSQLASTRASACLVKPSMADKVPEGTMALAMASPYHGFARAMQLFYADAMRSKTALNFAKVSEVSTIATGLVHPTAQIADDAHIESGAIIGREAQIGSGSIIAAGAVIGYRVHIGSNCYIGHCASVVHALLGDDVVVHAGVRIGQDGFGFAMGPEGHVKVPQIGRVLIHDHVEIGANSCIDRGALSDTIIGEGTKIDDLVMIGHNVSIGRSCIIVAKCGIAGSSKLGDFVVMGAGAGISGHVTIGSGAQIAGASHVKDDVPAGARMGGTPARPFREWARELAVIRKLANPKARKN